MICRTSLRSLKTQLKSCGSETLLSATLFTKKSYKISYGVVIKDWQFKRWWEGSKSHCRQIGEKKTADMGEAGVKKFQSPFFRVLENLPTFK